MWFTTNIKGHGGRFFMLCYFCNVGLLRPTIFRILFPLIWMGSYFGFSGTIKNFVLSLFKEPNSLSAVADFYCNQDTLVYEIRIKSVLRILDK